MAEESGNTPSGRRKYALGIPKKERLRRASKGTPPSAIRDARIEREWSQSELAEEATRLAGGPDTCHVKAAHVSAIERGAYGAFDVGTLLWVADAVGLDEEAAVAAVSATRDHNRGERPDPGRALSSIVPKAWNVLGLVDKLGQGDTHVATELRQALIAHAGGMPR